MKLVLRDVDLPLAAFSLRLEATLTAPVTALFGPSGAGKTSLLDLLAGLRKPATASIELDGEVLTDTARRIHLPARRRRLGYVPQDGALFPHLSVRRNLLYGHLPERTPPAFGLAPITELLGLGSLLERRIGDLSGGEKQRVALGRALLSAPRLLLLDEPLAALDAPLKARILPFLRAIRDELAVPMLYVTHQAEEIFELADDVLVLEQGRLLERGTPHEIFRPTSRPAYEKRARAGG